MHLVDDSDSVPVRTEAELLSYFATAGKPRSAWRVGSEHELIGVVTGTTEAPAYEGPHGIGKLFERFAANGGTPVIENGHMIALSRGDTQLTIEPGGQFELASRPFADDRDFQPELRTYLAELGAASREVGLTWLSIGFRPFATRVPWMPKLRYDVMRGYMPTVGTRGLDMMQRTATVQANLDFEDEANATAKMRCLYSVTSIMTALWAASPIVDGKPSGFQSYRAWIWRDTDNARSGLLPFIFDRSRSDVFHTYTQWALDVPMYFVYRGGYNTVPAELTFRRFLAEGWNGARATQSDWALHLSTLFPDGRLKKFIEVRGCDCGSFDMISALAPLAGEGARRHRPRRPRADRPGVGVDARAGRGDRRQRPHPGRSDPRAVGSPRRRSRGAGRRARASRFVAKPGGRR
ncbi:MAG: glutamate-cysteine ligase family protein [Proteobacteria bacterium]|nr:glutamate-cysteine ligase family protein [Pseudomonadota bacterium]